MPFERLSDRTPFIREGYWFATNKGGKMITIFLSPDSPLTKAKKVITHIGTGADAGLIMLSPSMDEGRAINLNTQKRGWHVRYTKLPGCKIKEKTRVQIKSRMAPDGSGIILEMPWYVKPEPRFSFNDQNINPQRSPVPNLMEKRPDPPTVTPKASNSDAANFSLRRVTPR